MSPLDFAGVMVPFFIVGDLVFYPRYRTAIPGTLARHQLSIVSQLMLIGDALAWLVWAVSKFTESKYGLCIWDLAMAIINIVAWRLRGYDDDLWNSTKRGCKRAVKRLASMRPRAASLRPVAGAA